MTPNEIMGFAEKVGNDRQFHGKHVRIKNEEGKYLTRTSVSGEIPFTDNLNLAYVYDYDADHVGEQLEQVKVQFGVTWRAEEVRMEEGGLKKTLKTKGEP